MKFVATMMLTIAMGCAISFSAVGEGLYWGYQFTSFGKAISTARDMGLSLSNTNEMGFEMHPYVVVNDFMRFGGTFALSYFRIYDNVSPQVFHFEKGGIIIGEVRLGILPELYFPCRRWDRAIGIGAGYGTVVTAIQDSNCSNDGKNAYFYFLRPQITAAYDLGASIALEIGAGYQFTFPVDDNTLW